MRHIVLLTALLSITVSVCDVQERNTGNGSVILFETDKKYPNLNLSLADIADIRYIKLQGEEEGLFVNETNSYCFYDETRKLIILSKTINPPFFVAVYDENGKLLRQIGHNGHGPGEYLGPLSMSYDENSGIITVRSSNDQKMLQYKCTGEFIREVSIEHQMKTSLLMQLDSAIAGVDFLSERYGSDKHFYKWPRTVFAFDSKTLEPVPIEDLHYARPMDMSEYESPKWAVSSVSEGYLITCARSDTTYLLDRKKRFHPYIVDIRHNIEKGNLLVPVFESKDYLFLCLQPHATRYPSGLRYYAIRKTDGSVYSCGGGALFSISEPQPLYFATYMITGMPGCAKYLIFKYEIDYVKEKGGKLPPQVEFLAEDMNEESNPILMIIKAKQ